jgi:hypothetical protein
MGLGFAGITKIQTGIGSRGIEKEVPAIIHSILLMMR